MIEYAKLNIPGPITTELTQPFWDAATEGRLRIQRCGPCEKYVFYPRPVCPHCWKETLKWQDVSGLGTLKSYSQIWKPGHPGWSPIAPYYVGLVQLSEGPTMLSHILDESQTLTIGDAVVFKSIQAGSHILPFFIKELT